LFFGEGLRNFEKNFGEERRARATLKARQACNYPSSEMGFLFFAGRKTEDRRSQFPKKNIDFTQPWQRCRPLFLRRRPTVTNR
jgi:hypothetical protein